MRTGDNGQDESRAVILYQYTIKGKQYTGNKVVHGDIWTSNFSDSCDDVIGMKKGSEITVYVNPKKPKISVLIQGYRGSFFWFMGMLFIFIVIVIMK